MKSKLSLWARELRYFLTSKLFLKNFGGMIGVIAISLMLVFLFMRIYTRHGSYITIPSYIGMTVEQAEALKGSKKLELIVIDSAAYSDTLDFGEIVMQDPAPEDKAKKGRNVYVTVNPFNPPLIALPRLWDRQLNMAESALRRTSFEWTVTRKPDRATNTVLEIYLVKEDGRKSLIKQFAKGEEPPRLPYGSELELIVAEGTGAAVGIPDLVCMTYSEAIATIESMQFSKGAVMVLGNVSDTASAYVWQQAPSAFDGLTINVGDPIDLWLQAEQPTCFDDF